MDNESTLTLLHTILQKKLPSNFFVFDGGKIRSLYDLITPNILEFAIQYPNFRPVDILMVYYEKVRISTLAPYLEMLKEFTTTHNLVDKMDNLEDNYALWLNEKNNNYLEEGNLAVKIINDFNAIKSLDLTGITVSPLKYTFVNRIVKPKIIDFDGNQEIIRDVD